jgi:hypothetical protein
VPDDIFLDQRSISPTKFSKEAPERLNCINNAPFFAYLRTDLFEPNVYSVSQGCCNSWECPKCGQQRAKQEYWRIVNGCVTLAETSKLYFITVTCKGKELSSKDATADYLIWTNRLLDALRINAKRRGVLWSYAQVTERQKRGHPHSHILTTYYPHDLVAGKVTKYVSFEGRQTKKSVDALRSDYLLERVISAGLGTQYDISEVASAEAAARYVAKYMFKGELFTGGFPKGWRRVRYSQSFPKNERAKGDSIVLLSVANWMELSRLATQVITKDDAAFEEALRALRGTGVSVLQVNENS